MARRSLWESSIDHTSPGVGLIHARKIVTVTAGDHAFQLDVDGETVAIVPRTTSREIHRYKAYATQAARPPAGRTVTQ